MVSVQVLRDLSGMMIIGYDDYVQLKLILGDEQLEDAAQMLIRAFEGRKYAHS
jgi:hypothetical protein